jgi:hypothetical protein
MAHTTRRNFLTTTAALGAGAIAAPQFVRAQGAAANDAINVAVIGVGGRGNEHIKFIKDVPGVRIVALCDPDSARTAAAAKDLPGVKEYVDLRKLLEDKDIDAVTIATCNHWHCLAAIWACEAGKQVYCEKPLSHRLWEGRQLIAAKNKHNTILQVGTQQRSDPMQAEIKDYLHDQRALGKIKSVVIPRFGVRASIGKRQTPLAPPESLDHNLWVGPSQDVPVYRDKWHYDWHWEWNTGDGECGNWGVHLLDDVVDNVFRDRHKLPERAASGGARLVWNDAGESPNVHMAYLEAGGTPVLFALSNLPAAPHQNSALKFDNVECGYVVLCEGGAYHGWRGGGVAVDVSGKTIRRFTGDSGAGHMKNFFDAVRAHDPKRLACPVELGHSSAGWCHVINAAYRTAATRGLHPPEPAAQTAGFDRLHKLIQSHLKAYGLEGASKLHSSSLLTMDPEAEQFTGEGAEVANAFLAKPEYRGEFAIPG